jgi:dihydrofolate synthase / folylpolyglutamate synthase
MHVAGTNGKGSTVAMLEALYGGRHETVACYTSPHVQRYNERIRINGKQLGDAEIVDSLRVVEAAREGLPLTYFEFGTLAALVAFAEHAADVLILEIGLGGRLDAVNALDPDGAVITNISLDHCDWLGPDIESIAQEKAGVMRGGIPVVFATEPVPEAIVSTARKLGSQLLLAGRDFTVRRGDDGWQYRAGTWSLEGLRPPSLRGAFQLDNAAGALALYVALEGSSGIDADRVNAAFSSLAVPGRLQRIDDERRWLLDVAHNPRAAEVLAQALRDLYPNERLVAVAGILADKDVTGIVQALLPQVPVWIAVPAVSPRALAAHRLAAQIAAAGDVPCRVASSVADGLSCARRFSTAEDLIVVTGSFFTVGPALDILRPASAD